ncbi:MAG TPA: RnfABCDGE type electron transport complex subunit B [Rhodanobacteraceae bacterium]
MPVRPATDIRAARALVDRIDAALPQTQCGRCGYAGCRPYAEAIARGEAPINRCPPGGMEGVRTLARITGQPVLALDPACGEPTPARVAVIDEDACIGCTKCIQACPVDAIVGASKLMHTVIADLCTGCGLCVAPCPVDCIAMLTVADAPPRVPRPDLPCPP